VTPGQIKRLRELPQLIADERDLEKIKLLGEELRDLTSLKLEEIRSRFPQHCRSCGMALSWHTDAMLEECDAKTSEP